MGELSRVIRYSLLFYFRRLKLIFLFSIPFLLAFVLLLIVQAPTYQALGGLFNRTGSIPELSILDIILIGIAYIVSVFIIADTITNVNLIIKAKRTRNFTSSEVVSAIRKYASRIFYIYTIMLLMIFVVQLLLYENPFKEWIYPLFTFILSFLLFFVAPAVVIDNEHTFSAVAKSIDMALKRPGFIVAWTLIGFVLLSLLKVFADLILPASISPYAVLFVNSLFVLPFLIVLQTQMYMEKYPLAR
jgi:hypothetical protein